MLPKGGTFFFDGTHSSPNLPQLHGSLSFVDVREQMRAGPRGKMMQQENRTKRFAQDEDGAVTIDWIVLTSVTIGLGVAVLSMLGEGTKSLTSRINEQMSTAAPAESGHATITVQTGL